MTSYHDTPNPKVVTVMDNSSLLPSLLLIPILILLFPAVLLLLLVSLLSVSQLLHLWTFFQLVAGGDGQSGLTNTISTITTASASASALDSPMWLLLFVPSGNIWL